MHRTFTVRHLGLTNVYMGFDNHWLTANAIALVSVEDGVDVWGLDSTENREVLKSTDELRRYYREIHSLKSLKVKIFMHGVLL